MGVLPVCVCRHHFLSWCPQNADEGIKFSGTWLCNLVTEGYEPPGGYWELNPDPMKNRINGGF